MPEKMQPKSKTKIDLTGQKFGRWTVLYEVEPTTNKRGYLDKRWICHCDCGTEKPVYERELFRGRTKSCGCIRKEVNRNRRMDLKGQRFGR